MIIITFCITFSITSITAKTFEMKNVPPQPSTIVDKKYFVNDWYKYKSLRPKRNANEMNMLSDCDDFQTATDLMSMTVPEYWSPTMCKEFRQSSRHTIHPKFLSAEVLTYYGMTDHDNFGHFSMIKSLYASQESCTCTWIL